MTNQTDKTFIPFYNTSGYISVYVTNTGIGMILKNQAYLSKTVYLLVEYTKTTDQATIQVQESSQITKSEKQEKSDYQDFTAPVTAGI